MWFCPSYHLAGVSLLPLDMGYLFLVGSSILQLTVVQQQILVLELSQEKMSVCPFAPPSVATEQFNNFWTSCYKAYFLNFFFFANVVLLLLCLHQTSRDSSLERLISQQTLSHRLMAIKGIGILSPLEILKYQPCFQAQSLCVGLFMI